MKRNIGRFPDEFVFKLTEQEWKDMRSQIVTAYQNKRNKGVTPYAFTEHGVAMLASVLKSEKAVEMNIAIVKAFIEMRQFSHRHYDLGEILNEFRYRLGEHDTPLAAIYDTIETLLGKKITEEERLEAWKNRDRIGF